MRVEFTWGIGFDKDRHIVYDVPVKLNLIREQAVHMFGGFSLTIGDGGWMDSADSHAHPIYENSVTLVVYGSSRNITLERATSFASEVKRIFNQTAVLVAFIDATHQMV